MRIEAFVSIGRNTKVKFLTILRQGTMVGDDIVIEHDVETSGRTVFENHSKVGFGSKFISSELNIGVMVGSEAIVTNSRVGHHSKIGTQSHIIDSIFNEYVLIPSNIKLKAVFAGPRVQFYSNVVVPELTVFLKNTIVIRAPETSKLLHWLLPYKHE